MRIEIVSKNFKAKDTLKELLEKKIGKFDKYFKKEATAKVRLSITGNDRYTMEITIIADNMRVRSEVTSSNMYDNIDIALPKIESQISKFRKKFDNRLNIEAFGEPSIYEVNIAEETAPIQGKVVKVKNFEIAMSSVDSAIEEMELLEHNFHVFINADTSKVNVLYKRNDGDYGLIDPEY